MSVRTIDYQHYGRTFAVGLELQVLIFLLSEQTWAAPIMGRPFFRPTAKVWLQDAAFRLDARPAMSEPRRSEEPRGTARPMTPLGDLTFMTTTDAGKRQGAGLAFAYVTTLFFAWGFATSLIDTADRGGEEGVRPEQRRRPS